MITGRFSSYSQARAIPFFDGLQQALAGIIAYDFDGARDLSDG